MLPLDVSNGNCLFEDHEHNSASHLDSHNRNGHPEMSLRSEIKHNSSVVNGETFLPHLNESMQPLTIAFGWSNNTQPQNFRVSEKENHLFKQNQTPRNTSLESRLKEAESVWKQLYVQHNKLSELYEQTQSKQMVLKKELEEARTQISTLQRQLEFNTINRTEEKDTTDKWTSKFKTLEIETAELKRCKEKLLRTNKELEEHVTQLQSRIEAKQEQTQTLLTELGKMTSQVEQLEAENQLLNSRSAQNERKVKDLVRELGLVKETTERLKLGMQEAESYRQEAEKRVHDLDVQYRQTTQRYHEEVEHMTGQLEAGRLREDELFAKAQATHEQNHVYRSMIEDLKEQLEASLKNASQSGEKFRQSDQIIENLQSQLTNCQSKISIMETEKQKYENSLRSLEDDKSQLIEQINSMENLIAQKSQELSLVQFQYQITQDRLIQMEKDADHFVRNTLNTKYQMQRQHNLLLKSVQRKCKVTVRKLRTKHVHLQKKVWKSDWFREQMVHRIHQQKIQMDRLNHILWETAWSYVQTQENQRKQYAVQTEICDKNVQTVEFDMNPRNIHESTTPSMKHEKSQQKCNQNCKKILEYISGRLDGLSRLCQIPEQHWNKDRKEHERTFREWLLEFKLKMDHLKQVYNQLSQSNKNSQVNLNHLDDTLQSHHLEHKAIQCTETALVESNDETLSEEKALIKVSQLAQNTAHQLKQSHSRVEENLNIVRNELLRLQVSY